MAQSYLFARSLQYNIKTTDRDLAFLSASAYHANLQDKLLKEGWNILKVNYIHPPEGFYALVARKEHDVVLAVRGTDDSEDIESGLSIVMGQVPSQLKQAYQFTDIVIAQLSSTDNLIFTGHSLGGAIAQVLTLRYGCNSVVFDPLGIAPLTDSLDNINMDNKYLIKIYIGASNIINNLVKQIDTPNLYRIGLPESGEGECWDLDCVYEHTRYHHDIVNLAMAFNDNTGLPYNYEHIDNDEETVIGDDIMGVFREVYEGLADN